LTRRFGLPASVALAGVSVVILFSPSYAFHTLIGTYAFMFCFGMLVADLGRKGILRAGAKTAKICAILAVAAMMSARLLLGYGSLWSLLVEGTGSAVLIGVLAFGPRLAAHDIFETKPLRFLGRISYSFYLYHPLALALVVPWLTWVLSEAALAAHPFVGSMAIALISVALTIPLAMASYTLVERPMIAVGRRL
jgi:peptidoglycan/LPS O-acetylase OafA/YrhL